MAQCFASKEGVEKHHEFLPRELPRLCAMADRVAQVHGGHVPSLVSLRNVFANMASQLFNHTEKEEKVLFPAIVQLSKGVQAPPLDGPINCMREEHDDAGEALDSLRGLANGFQPPADACNTYRALFAGLAELEEDLRAPIQLENGVLFPSAKERQAS